MNITMQLSKVNIFSQKHSQKHLSQALAISVSQNSIHFYPR